MLSSGDIARMGTTLADFMPESATLKRISSSQTGGDQVMSTMSTQWTGKARVMPTTSNMKGWPEAIVEQAEYIITLESGCTAKDQDVVEIGSTSYKLISVRYDNASWAPCVRALAVRNE